LDQAYARAHVAVKPGPYVMISVSDTGVGMTPEVRNRVFEPFLQPKKRAKGQVWVYLQSTGLSNRAVVTFGSVVNPGKGLNLRFISHESMNLLRN
jgi:hypothetical protein